MRRIKTIVSILAFSAASLIAAKTRISIYSNFAVISGKIKVKANEKIFSTEIPNVPTSIRQSSFQIGGDCQVLETKLDRGKVKLNLYKNFLDKKIGISDGKTSYYGYLRFADDALIILESPDGKFFYFKNPSRFDLEAADLIKIPKDKKPSLKLKIKTKKKGLLELPYVYQSDGFSWKAVYNVVLDENEKTMSIECKASIENRSGADFKNVSVKLISGEVSRVGGYDYDYYSQTRTLKVQSAPPEFADEKNFFEYREYKIPRPLDLKESSKVFASLFARENVPVKKIYEYRTNADYASAKGVSVLLSFKNDEKNNLGTPFPKGIAEFYKYDGSSLEFIGENNVAAAPEGSEIKIQVGTAFDIIAEEKIVSETKIAKNVYEKEKEIKIRNEKQSDETVKILFSLPRFATVVESSVDYKKISDRLIEFDLNAASKSETTLRVRTRISY